MISWVMMSSPRLARCLKLTAFPSAEDFPLKLLFISQLIIKVDDYYLISEIIC